MLLNYSADHYHDKDASLISLFLLVTLIIITTEFYLFASSTTKVNFFNFDFLLLLGMISHVNFVGI